MTASTASTAEKYRPSLHFSAQDTWVNDPNGLIYHDGLYHLYYQNNPFGNVWGNMSWGHATSPDLLSWTRHPVAIACDENEDIFSGSIVFDKENTSGFGTSESAPLIAFYTSAYKPGNARHGIQAQSVAYSLDGGYSWSKHSGNPVIDRNSPEFRDPKVFRYSSAETSYWVMVTVEAQDHQVVLYKSENLLDWQYLSTFGPANATSGVWECPDLFELPVDGGANGSKWVLVVNLNPGGPNNGSAGQYFVGQFDGTTFTSESTVTEGRSDNERLNDYQWLDWGRDYYAAVSFGDVPDGRRLMISWMNNWEYANQIPTSPWRSPMSLAREVTLQTIDGAPRLVQKPAFDPKNELGSTQNFGLDSVQLDDEVRVLDQAGGAVQRIELSVTPGTANEVGLVVRGGQAEGTRIGVNVEQSALFVDRRNSGESDFHESFASLDKAPILPLNGSYELTIFVDHCSVEIFAQGGSVTITDLIFPSPESIDLSLYATGGSAQFSNVDVVRFY
ncbi:glycoside hydrolase family 32 protein [Arthrobacter sp. S41]|uniref:glycoside hydrolase family 32 protein n=1 Tax=Arthrobacter sp. S41 TaxID=2509721 RepID=UPI001035A51F|nr:glycoside hydrolase family 32 protein [Arthrobacter sp. S41]TAP25963.1 glycoside hydrolase family 32 protein [Arthrobacter sp. S41]